MSASSVLPLLEALGFTFGSTVGAILIGSFASIFLAGITTVQTYTYYRRSKADAQYFKAAIYVLWILDVLHSALLASSTYTYAKLLVFNPLELLIPRWNFSVDLPLGSISDFVVSIVYVERIWRLSGKRLLPVVFVILSVSLSLASFGASLAIFVVSFRVRTYIEFTTRYRWLWYIEFGCRSLVDIGIAATLTILLKRRKSRVERTNAVIHFIVMYGVNTGIFATAFSVAAIITYALLPMSFIPFAVTACLPKLMFNSMLSLLNSRQRIRDQHFKADILSIHLSQLRPLNHRPVIRQEGEDFELGLVHSESTSTAVKSEGLAVS